MPPSRLVARTLEGQWEKTLLKQARPMANYERFRRDQPQGLSVAEIAAVHKLAGAMVSDKLRGASDARAPADRTRTG